MNKWTRRAFITTGTLIGGGLALGVGGILLAPNRLLVDSDKTADAARLTIWIKITPDNRIAVVIPHCEMGQGAQTALAMMAAEEMEADWNLVGIEEAPAESLYANGDVMQMVLPTDKISSSRIRDGLSNVYFQLSKAAQLQITGGSASVRATGHYAMREAGASAKAMLLAAAAQQWQVPVEECEAKLSRVTHGASARSATFGELAMAAAAFTPPKQLVLKARTDYSIVGTQRSRLDIPNKVTGKAIFGIDIALPDMLYAAVAAAPVNGGKLVSVDTKLAAAMPGVKSVIKLDNAVAVVADSYWRAQKALRALTPEFSDAGQSATTSASLLEGLHTALSNEKGSENYREGDGTDALKNATNIIEAKYSVPFLAHAAMEPLSATVKVSGDHAEVWAGSQDPLNARKTAATALDLKSEQVTYHNQLLGGSFGRRLPGSHDFIAQAAQIAKVMQPHPVKLIWSREEDTRHDFYRPMVAAHFRGALDGENNLQTWVSRFTGGFSVVHGEKPVYKIPHLKIDHVDKKLPIRTGSLRSVEFSYQAFFTESFIDELAHAGSRDPFEFRRDLLVDLPRHRRVLERVAAMAGWNETLPDNRGRGIALVEAFGTIIAQVAEVEVGADGVLKVHRICAAVDCGTVVNPDGARAQIEGGIIFGLSAALYGEITIDKGAVVESSFPDYRVLQIAETPIIDIAFLESEALLGGLGEPGVPPVAPALSNAIFAVTGKRIRDLPIKDHKLQKEVAQN